jgi:hypothetical protein
MHFFRLAHAVDLSLTSFCFPESVIIALGRLRPLPQTQFQVRAMFEIETSYLNTRRKVLHEKLSLRAIEMYL